MIVPDSGVWIDYYNRVRSPQVDRLKVEMADSQIVVTDVIIREFLQGIRDDRAFADARKLMNMMKYRPFWGKHHMEQAAANYRALRKLGVTICSPNDIVIATFCIENDYPLLHNDHDFDHIEQYLDLKVAR